MKTACELSPQLTPDRLYSIDLSKLAISSGVDRKPGSPTVKIPLLSVFL